MNKNQLIITSWLIILTSSVFCCQSTLTECLARKIPVDLSLEPMVIMWRYQL